LFNVLYLHILVYRVVYS